MRAISLFSGAGGMDVGFAQEGIHSFLACEMNPEAAATYRSNLPGRVFAGDVAMLIPTLGRGIADVVFGGPPCQGYSVAGRMNAADPRSALIGAFLDAVERVRPTVFVMENVDALATLGKWRPALDAFVARAGATGYATHVAVLDASDFGVPQQRRRMFAWGVLGGDPDMIAACVSGILASARTGRTSARDVLCSLGRVGSERNPETCSARITFARNPVLRASPHAGMLFNGGGRPIDPNRPAPTIAASAGGNRTHIVDEDEVFEGAEGFVARYHAHLRSGGHPLTGSPPSRLRRLTLAESAAFQTFPEDFAFSGSRCSRYRQIGNAVPVRLARVVAAAAACLSVRARSDLPLAA